MLFTITEASDCPVDFGSLNGLVKNVAHVHLTCSSKNALINLITEFGAHSRNSADSYESRAPEFFAASNKGTGQNQINNPIVPYLLDQDHRFTTNEQDSKISGVFINKDDLETIKGYIGRTFPGADIIDGNDVLTMHNR